MFSLRELGLGDTQAELARSLNVSQATISRLIPSPFAEGAARRPGASGDQDCASHGNNVRRSLSHGGAYCATT